MNRIAQKLIREARVPNVSSPSFNDKEVLDIISNAGYGNEIKGSQRVETGTGDNEQGSKGFWSIATAQGNKPTIYYNEIYSFNVDNGVQTFVITWAYDENLNITNNTCVTSYPDASVRSILSTYRSGTNLENGNSVTGVYNSIDEATTRAQEVINAA